MAKALSICMLMRTHKEEKLAIGGCHSSGVIALGISFFFVWCNFQIYEGNDHTQSAALVTLTG